MSLGGRAWQLTLTFEVLLARVAESLGCPHDGITAELYKLLIYDEGGFFKAHRDTEKTEGMFGTLVVCLPSAHTGGDLLVRHAGREVRARLHTGDPGEIRGRDGKCERKHFRHELASALAWLDAPQSKDSSGRDLLAS